VQNYLVAVDGTHDVLPWSDGNLTITILCVWLGYVGPAKTKQNKPLHATVDRFDGRAAEEIALVVELDRRPFPRENCNAFGGRWQTRHCEPDAGRVRRSNCLDAAGVAQHGANRIARELERTSTTSQAVCTRVCLSAPALATSMLLVIPAVVLNDATIVASKAVVTMACTEFRVRLTNNNENGWYALTPRHF
jgi:hypothetical protein